MKKTIIAIFVISTAIVLTSCSNKEREEKRINALVAEGEFVVMTEYLDGDDPLVQYAVKSAITNMNDFLGRTEFYTVPLNPKPYRLQAMQQSFAVLEKAFGLDSLASIIYQEFKYDQYGGFIETESGAWWNARINWLMQLVTLSVHQRIQALVMEKMEDPFWVSRYIPREKMVQLILSDRFGSEKSNHFTKCSNDSLLVADLSRNTASK
jgi:hypothetical protein